MEEKILIVKKCSGCGVILQTENTDKAGYVTKEKFKTEKKLLCQRCFKMKHYGKIQDVELTKEDYNKYDYIIGMENSNIVRIKAIVGEDTENKIYKLLDFTNNKKDIADPWYTGNFAKTYEEVLKGCQALYNYLTKE